MSTTYFVCWENLCYYHGKVACVFNCLLVSLTALLVYNTQKDGLKFIASTVKRPTC
jgi:hypothetical protein